MEKRRKLNYVGNIKSHIQETYCIADPTHKYKTSHKTIFHIYQSYNKGKTRYP